MMRLKTILVAGASGSGKTEAIESVGVGPARVEQLVVNDLGANGKPQTVELFEIGHCSELCGGNFRFLGIPAASDTELDNSLVALQSDGIVLLVDDTNDRSLSDLTVYIKRHKAFLVNTHVVVGVTKTDLSGGVGSNLYEYALIRAGIRATVREVDPRDADDVLSLVNSFIPHQEHENTQSIWTGTPFDNTIAAILNADSGDLGSVVVKGEF